MNHNPDKPIVTVGIIVKNEEKNLERCLKSLIPLQQALTCEIVVVDTGSTDSTKEIAQKYTNNIYDFAWENDFAAARNAVLAHTQGIWYLTIDADEYLDQEITPLVDFLQSSENEQYQAARWCVRSYTSKDGRDYIDAMLPRIFRVIPGMQYVSPIHEYIPLPEDLNKIANIKVLVHHTGYYFETVEQQILKAERNMPLVEAAYQAEPHNLWRVAQWIDTLLVAKQVDRACEVVQQALPQVQASLPDKQAQRVLQKAVLCAQTQKEDAQVLAYVALYEETAKQDISNPDFYYPAILSSYRMEDTDNIAVYGKKYLESLLFYHQEMFKDNLQWESRYITEGNCALAQSIYWSALEKQRDYDALLSSMAQGDFLCMQIEFFKGCIYFFVDALTYMEAPETVAHLYTQVQQMREKGQQDKVQAFESVLLALLENMEEHAVAIQRLIIGSDDPMEKLLKFSRLSNEAMSQTAQDMTDWEKLPLGYAYYYLMMKQALPLPDCAYMRTVGDIQKIALQIIQLYQDFPQILSEYAEHASAQAYFFSIMIGILLPAVTASHQEQEIAGYLNRYVAIIENCLPEIYTEEIRSDTHCHQMEPSLCFGYWILQAQHAEHDTKRYLYCLKRAMVAWPENQSVVQYLLDKVQEKLHVQEQAEQQQKTEMQRLAEAVKQQARALITEGRIEEVRAILMQLQQLCPEDTEIQELNQMLSDIDPAAQIKS